MLRPRLSKKIKKTELLLHSNNHESFLQFRSARHFYLLVKVEVLGQGSGVSVRSDVASQQLGNDLDTDVRDREAESEQCEYSYFWT